MNFSDLSQSKLAEKDAWARTFNRNKVIKELLLSPTDDKSELQSLCIWKKWSLFFQLFKGPSLPNLFKKNKDSDQEGSSTGAEEETSFGSEYSGGKRVSRIW